MAGLRDIIYVGADEEQGHDDLGDQCVLAPFMIFIDDKDGGCSLNKLSPRCPGPLLLLLLLLLLLKAESQQSLVSAFFMPFLQHRFSVSSLI